MKNIIRFTAVALAATMLASAATSCVGDLDVKPIDPNIELPENVLNSQEAFTALLAKCYQGLSCSASSGPSSDPDIEGVDGGYGQYMRALFNMEELSTDVATCCWNDGGLFDIHNLNWNASNEFILSMYYRIFFQISLCNEFIRRSNASDISGYSLKNAYIAEARALQALQLLPCHRLVRQRAFRDRASVCGFNRSRADLPRRPLRLDGERVQRPSWRQRPRRAG